MSPVEELMPSGDKMKKALLWISESLRDNPVKNRQQVISEAQIRFDLSPKECDFIDRKLRDNGTACS